MKKKLVSLMLVLVMGIMLCSCSKKTDNKLSVKEDILNLKIGDHYTINVENADQPLTWFSANQSVVTVSPEGTLEAVSDGVTTVTVEAGSKYAHIGVIVRDDGGYYREDGVYVNFYNKPSDIEEIIVGVKGGSKSDTTVHVGDTWQLVAYTTPSDSKDPVEWSSEDPAIASVSADGKLQVNKKGNTTIKAIAPNGVTGELLVRCK